MCNGKLLKHVGYDTSSYIPYGTICWEGLESMFLVRADRIVLQFSPGPLVP